MDATGALLGAIAGAATSLLTFALLATVMRARLMRQVAGTVAKTATELVGRFRDDLSADVVKAQEQLGALRSERGRVMALIRHRGGADGYDDDEGDDDGDDDRHGWADSPFVQALAGRLGINLERVKAGDPQELAKVQAIVERVAPAQGGAAGGGSPEGPPADDLKGMVGA